MCCSNLQTKTASRWMSKASNLGFAIHEVDWGTAQAELRQIRQSVFIEEQQVPVELEWDGLDEQALHLLAVDTLGKPIGCARILPEGIIGRMAVIKEWRGQGVGQALLGKAVNVCRTHGWQNVTLSAQTHAISFYELSGFVICSEEYLDAGIPHRDMRLDK